MKHLVVLIIVVLLAVSCEGLRKYPVKKQPRCSKYVKCPCGSVCVKRFRENSLCTSRLSVFCKCRTACQVFDQIILPNQSKKVYCNTCRCPTNGGIPACTRAAWCLPKDPKYKSMKVYPGCSRKG